MEELTSAVKTVDAVLRARSIDPSKQKFFHVGILYDPYLPLVIKSIGTGPTGHAAVSVCQYGVRDGVMVRDSEMWFEVIRDSERPDHVVWRPYYYQNDYVGCVQVSVWRNENGEVKVDAEILKNQIEFASTWDLMLQEQGFYEAA